MPKQRKIHKELSREQLDEWLENPVTKAWFASVREKAYLIGVGLMDGAAVDETPDKVALNYMKVVGIRTGLYDALDINLDVDEPRNKEEPKE